MFTQEVNFKTYGKLFPPTQKKLLATAITQRNEEGHIQFSQINLHFGTMRKNKDTSNSHR